MQQSLYLSDNLDDVESLQQELSDHGITPEHMHIISDQEAEVTRHHLLNANPFSKTNIVRGTLSGMCVGILLFSFILFVLPRYFSFDPALGITLFVFIALISLGISTWEGGLWGIQQFNKRFKKLESNVHNGQHLVIIDHEKSQAHKLNEIITHHKSVAMVST